MVRSSNQLNIEYSASPREAFLLILEPVVEAGRRGISLVSGHADRRFPSGPGHVGHGGGHIWPENGHIVNTEVGNQAGHVVLRKLVNQVAIGKRVQFLHQELLPRGLGQWPDCRGSRFNRYRSYPGLAVLGAGTKGGQYQYEWKEFFHLPVFGSGF